MKEYIVHDMKFNVLLLYKNFFNSKLGTLKTVEKYICS